MKQFNFDAMKTQQSTKTAISPTIRRKRRRTKKKKIIDHSQGMSRREAALILFPCQRIPTAVARLRRWIEADPELLSALKRAGYRTGIHHFSPKICAVFKTFFSGF